MRVCFACGTTLTPDNAVPDTDYAFDNALWIGFHGGYGMFVDNIAAQLPNNTEDRWLRDADGEYLIGVKCDCDVGNPDVTMEYHELSCPRRNPVDNPLWEPTYDEPRTLPGQPDYECVICHECAHMACEVLPWLERLLQPLRSHSHRTAWKEAHPEHDGWDYHDSGDG